MAHNHIIGLWQLLISLKSMPSPLHSSYIIPATPIKFLRVESRELRLIRPILQQSHIAYHNMQSNSSITPSQTPPQFRNSYGYQFTDHNNWNAPYKAPSHVVVPSSVHPTNNSQLSSNYSQNMLSSLRHLGHKVEDV